MLGGGGPEKIPNFKITNGFGERCIVFVRVSKPDLLDLAAAALRVRGKQNRVCVRRRTQPDASEVPVAVC